MSQIQTIIFEGNGNRLDEYVASKTGFSRSRIKNLIDEGLILVNDKQQKAGYSLRCKDTISINIPENKPLEVVAQDVDFDIIFENDDYAIIDKPQGLVVHPANGNEDGTLVNGLLKRLKNLSGINGVIRPGIVHRIDKDTSGLLVVAKNDDAHINLSNQIQNKTCHRIYVALLKGNVKEECGKIETGFDRSKKDRKKMSAYPIGQGKLAVTNYKVLKHFGTDYSLLEFSLQTGRTHQIRVHSAYIGHPIVGDLVYGKEDKNIKTNGQLLHAHKLELDDTKTGERKCFTSNLPKYFQEILEKLDKKYN